MSESTLGANGAHWERAKDEAQVIGAWRFIQPCNVG